MRPRHRRACARRTPGRRLVRAQAQRRTAQPLLWLGPTRTQPPRPQQTPTAAAVGWKHLLKTARAAWGRTTRRAARGEQASVSVAPRSTLSVVRPRISCARTKGPPCAAIASSKRRLASCAASLRQWSQGGKEPSQQPPFAAARRAVKLAPPRRWRGRDRPRSCAAAQRDRGKRPPPSSSGSAGARRLGPRRVHAPALLPRHHNKRKDA